MTDTRLRRWIYGLAALWVLLTFLSFERFSATAPTGDSFVRGLNRIGVWLRWQLGALSVGGTAGLLAWKHRTQLPRRDRWVGWVPALVTGSVFALLILGFLAMVVFGFLQR